MKLSDQQDAYGHAVYDYFRGLPAFEIIERDDGYFSVTNGPGCYFEPFEKWPLHEKEIIQAAYGKVLDIGCGAGRHALLLQEKGCQVVAIDNSPLAVKTARLRGVKHAKVIDINELEELAGQTFDTICLLGNNLGLLQSAQHAVRILKEFEKITHHNSVIIADSKDPYATQEPEHLQYHEYNKQRGRMPGQVRMRVRYKKYVTPWFDYLFLSIDELGSLLTKTLWRIAKVVQGEGGAYGVLLKRRV